MAGRRRTPASAPLPDPDGLERRVFPLQNCEIREATEDGGPPVFAGYAAVFGQLSVDLGGFRERIQPGCFADALDGGADVRLLINHDANLILGRTTAGTLSLREDDHGLYVEAPLPDTSYARDLVVSMRRGDIAEMSFGFIPKKDDWQETDEETGLPIRELVRAGLFDVSPVTFPAYPSTSAEVRSRAAAVRESRVLAELRTVTGMQDFKLAERDHGWDADAATGRLRDKTAAEDAPNADYAKCFFWHDGEAADEFGSYKLPYVDVVDDELVAVPRAIFAVAAALDGGRGGTTIPDDEQDEIRTVVGDWYAKMADEFGDDTIVAPWSDEAKSAFAGTVQERTEKYGRALVGGWITLDRVRALEDLAAGTVAWDSEDGVMDLMDDISSLLNPPGDYRWYVVDLAVGGELAVVCDWQENAYWLVPVTIGDDREPELPNRDEWKRVESAWVIAEGERALRAAQRREGKVLSSKNHETISGALDTVQGAAESLQSVLDAAAESAPAGENSAPEGDHREGKAIADKHRDSIADAVASLGSAAGVLQQLLDETDQPTDPDAATTASRPDFAAYRALLDAQRALAEAEERGWEWDDDYRVYLLTQMIELASGFMGCCDEDDQASVEMMSSLAKNLAGMLQAALDAGATAEPAAASARAALDALKPGDGPDIRTARSRRLRLAELETEAELASEA
jgi:uncharacterized protein